MNNNTISLLIAAAFGLIGFAIGRVTCPPSACAPSGTSHEIVRMMKTMDFQGEYSGDNEVEIIIEELSAEGFEGDTVMVIPGGTARIQKHGNEIEVSVEMVEP
ncbi:MAG: hypothetical protein ACPGYK_05480 [Flavobacteriales bacterium]